MFCKMLPIFCVIMLFVKLLVINGNGVSQEGYRDEQTNFTLPQCPDGYVLDKGLCFLASDLHVGNCPEGYRFSTDDGLCYPIHMKPCPNEPITPLPPTTTTTTTTTTTEATTTTSTEATTTTTTEATTTTTTEATTTTTTEATTEAEPITTTRETATTTFRPDALARCPPDTVFLDGQCRKILCTMGEYYKGRCLQPACPVGTVWRGKRCQTPGYLTTIIEIENVVTNEKRNSVVTENINNVEYLTSAPESTTHPTLEQSTVAPPPGNLTETCCSVITPRICKNYGRRWVCFNRRNKLCDPRVCRKPTVYLKPPQIVHKPPLLIMPPNPPLAVCESQECDEGAVDCSGCVDNDREHCSSYCFLYHCPDGSCQYIDLQDYCKLYPGEFGCNDNDGCIWDWCTVKC